MIALLLTAALHVTGPERFFCDDLHNMTLRECVHLTRRWICSPEDVGDEIDTMPLYHRTVVEERRLVCHHARAKTYNYEGCNSPRFMHFMDRDWRRYSRADFACMERGKCGPYGVRFWDDGGPVCNVEGWNGRRYRKENNHA